MNRNEARFFLLSSFLLITYLIPGFLPTAIAGTTPDYHYPDSNISTNGTVRVVLFYGGKLYVGGNFSKVTDATGSYNRTDIAAYDMATRRVTNFKANTNSGTVRAIVAGGGRLFVGGSFTKINKVSCSKVAALDPTSGDVLTEFRKKGATIDGSVWALALSNKFLFVGGSFTSIDGQARTDLASLDKDSGTLIQGFNPAPSDPYFDSIGGQTEAGIWALQIHPNNPDIVFVGGNYQTIAGETDRKFVTALNCDGTPGPAFRNPASYTCKAMDVNGSSLYVATGGYANRVYCFDISKTPYERKWRGIRTQGDVQAVTYAPPGYVYFGFHDGLLDSLDDYRCAVLDATTGDLYDAYPPINTFFGVWALDAVENYLAIGGDFTQMNGLPQGYLAVFTKLPYTPSGPLVPAIPVLYWPAENEAALPVDLTLFWNYTVHAATYEVQVSADSQFSHPVDDAKRVTECEHGCRGLDNAQWYWWRVRASNSAGAGGWSIVRKFSTIPGDDDVPVLWKPVDGEGNQPLDVDIAWRPTRSALSYGIQVSEVWDFSTTIVNREGLADTGFHLSGLAHNTRYYWRVNALTCGGTTNWASAGFQTIVAMPKAPRCLAPVNNAGRIVRQTALRWERAQDAVSYRVQVATDRSFQKLIYDTSGVTDTMVVIGGLIDDTRYFWRVNAVNAGGTVWSLPMQFTTIFPFPLAPVQVFPPPGYIAKSDSLRLVWKQSKPHVTKYWVEIANDSAMRDVYIDSTAIDTESIRSHLDNKTEFWWRVRACNETGWSAYSEKRRFKTAFIGVWEKRFSLDKFLLSARNGVITYSVAKQCDVRIELVDLRGKTVWKVLRTNRAPGSYRETLQSSKFPVGAYFLSFRAGSFVRKADATLVR